MADDRSTVVQKILTYGALGVVLALILIPYLYVIVTAFKPPGEIYDTTWLPRAISVQAWRDVFVFNHFHVYLLNSLIAGVGSALLAVAISLPGAYIFARKEFPFREPFFYLIVGTLIFPFILLIVPITITWIKIGLFDTFSACGSPSRSSRCRIPCGSCAATSPSCRVIWKRRRWSTAAPSSRRSTA